MVYNDKLFEVERRGEVAAIAEDNEHDKALDKLRRAADAKLRKERDLATTRMLERDALARQVTQLQAQLRHKDALRHPYVVPFRTPFFGSVLGSFLRSLL